MFCDTTTVLNLLIIVLRSQTTSVPETILPGLELHRIGPQQCYRNEKRSTLIEILIIMGEVGAAGRWNMQDWTMWTVFGDQN